MTITEIPRKFAWALITFYVRVFSKGFTIRRQKYNSIRENWEKVHGAEAIKSVNEWKRSSHSEQAKHTEALAHYDGKKEIKSARKFSVFLSPSLRFMLQTGELRFIVSLPRWERDELSSDFCEQHDFFTRRMWWNLLVCLFYHDASSKRTTRKGTTQTNLFNFKTNIAF